jgi:peptidoglycan/LPS O-acetylase OafA/YrhL
MRSSSGLYISRLDHVRAAAAFLVYCWHVIHVQTPFAVVPDFFLLSLIEEGHAGVGLFMTLSGYLFAKITDGRTIVYATFLWNRLVRLAPLLILVLAYWAARGHLDLTTLLTGLVLPHWPGGAWSIVVELHFYLLFPFILLLQRRHRTLPLIGLLAVALALRSLVWWYNGSVQDIAYWTIGGCIDMFLGGMLWHELAKRKIVRAQAAVILAMAVFGFAAFWHVFNIQGGFYGLDGANPSLSPLWIVIPLVQGIAFGAIIATYERLDVSVPEWIDKPLALVGAASYSLYLLHFIVFTAMVKKLAAIGLPMDQFPVSLAIAVLTFPAMAIIAILSFWFIEQPFLRLRAAYVSAKHGHGERATGSQWTSPPPVMPRDKVHPTHVNQHGAGAMLRARVMEGKTTAQPPRTDRTSVIS